jgi:hypothetical protein
MGEQISPPEGAEEINIKERIGELEEEIKALGSWGTRRLRDRRDEYFDMDGKEIRPSKEEMDRMDIFHENEDGSTHLDINNFWLNFSPDIAYKPFINPKQRKLIEEENKVLFDRLLEVIEQFIRIREETPLFDRRVVEFYERNVRLPATEAYIILRKKYKLEPGRLRA